MSAPQGLKPPAGARIGEKLLRNTQKPAASDTSFDP